MVDAPRDKLNRRHHPPDGAPVAGFGIARQAWEGVLKLAYFGGWPAALWNLIPGSSRVRVVCHEIQHSQVSRTTRIAFVSDIHIGPTTSTGVLDESARLIREAGADILLLGGDYVFLDATPRKLARLRAWVESTEVDHKYAVMGNHDLWTHHAEIARTLEEAGAAVLFNEEMELPGGISLLGLDDPWSGHCRVPAASTTDSPKFRVVLCHAPDGLLECQELSFDLYLCGHTHGGQIATPNTPIGMSHGQLCRALPHGFRTYSGKKVFVSRGIGGIDVPIRVFSPPDILLLDIVPA